MVKSFAFNKQNDRKIEDTIKEENEREKKTKKIRMEERERDGLHKKKFTFSVLYEIGLQSRACARGV